MFIASRCAASGTSSGRRSELVLLGASELVDGVALFGEGAHRLVGEHVVQAVVGHVVEDGDAAVLVARPAVHQQVRCLGHELLPASDDDLELAGTDQLVGECDRSRPDRHILLTVSAGTSQPMPAATAA